MSSLRVQNAYLTEMLKQAGLDAEAHDVAQRIQFVLTDEIHHRMKNMLTIVTAIVRQSMRSATSLVEAESAISTRLIAMGRAHDMLLKADLKSADLADVIAGAVAPHNSAAGAIEIAGEEMQVMSSAILPLTLILNELCTNATKYGALSCSEGRVSVQWRVQDGMLRLNWEERGGPPVLPPAKKGFGSRLLEELVIHDLGGDIKFDYDISGLRCRIIATL